MSVCRDTESFGYNLFDQKCLRYEYLLRVIDLFFFLFLCFLSLPLCTVLTAAATLLPLPTFSVHAPTLSTTT